MRGHLIVVRGLPGSGKSTWAKNVKALPGTNGVLVVERDIVRTQEFGLDGKGTLSRESEAKVTGIVQQRILDGLALGLTVIESSTNLRDKGVRELLGLAVQSGATCSIKAMNTALDVCLERNASRDAKNRVPEDVIRGMASKFKNFRDDLDPYVKEDKKVTIDSSPYVQPVEGGQVTYFFDIDGTIADCSGVRNPYDTSLYHLDKLNVQVAYILNLLRSTGARIIIMSGRHVDFYDVTRKWLKDHGIGFDELIMREREGINDAVEKVYLFDKYVRDKGYLIMGVFDDRQRVVDAWRNVLGLRCFQVAPGDF